MVKLFFSKVLIHLYLKSIAVKVSKGVIKYLGIFIPIFSLIILVGSFYGLKEFRKLSIALSFLMNSMSHTGASVLLFPLFGRDYRNFWHMIARRAVFPVFISPVIMFFLPTAIVLFLNFISGNVMNEESVIAFAFLNVTAFILLAVLRVIYEILRPPNLYTVSYGDILLGLILLMLSALITPFFLHYGDFITTEFSRKGYNLTAGFLIRYLLSAIPSAMFSVPYFMLLNVERIRLQ